MTKWLLSWHLFNRKDTMSVWLFLSRKAQKRLTYLGFTCVALTLSLMPHRVGAEAICYMQQSDGTIIELEGACSQREEEMPESDSNEEVIVDIQFSDEWATQTTSSQTRSADDITHVYERIFQTSPEERINIGEHELYPDGTYSNPRLFVY